VSLPVGRQLARLFPRRDSFSECEVCGDVDGWETMAELRDGRVACWHCAERAGEFCILEAGLTEWRGDHLVRCVVCRDGV
jgi:hypothetical protein